MMERLPPWAHDWLDVIIPAAQIALIVLVAALLLTASRRLIKRLSARAILPPELVVGARRVIAFLIYSATLLFVLDRLGVSGTVLWTAFTGFAAVAAVAFFAAWSVLSNIFCTILIVMTRPFRLHDHIELLENGEKPGLKGRVVDINLIYTTIQETDAGQGSTVLQIPNNLFFQRTIRRWRGGVPLQSRIRSADDTSKT
ncbi:MAG: mechanosensitive ion channel family protein [Porticoccaceae bacterium]|jgi:small-conductance mechanosensitive channel